jgi:SH3-like domain-containing protein
MLRRRFLFTLTLCLWVGFSSVALVTSTPNPAHAQSSEDAEESGTNAKLPLPRFVSLRNSEVNMRAGPGVRYPVDWVYLRRDLPVEIIAEFDIWRKIRDPDGAEGWVHKSMLSGRRMMMVKKDHVMLRRTADDTASAAAWLENGVIGKILQCPKESAFCRVEVEGDPGWLRRDEMWGVYRSDVIE